jgi:hypothetical protein
MLFFCEYDDENGFANTKVPLDHILNLKSREGDFD